MDDDVQGLRRSAAQVGLRVLKRGDSYTLLDVRGDWVVLSDASFDEALGHVHALVEAEAPSEHVPISRDEAEFLFASLAIALSAQGEPEVEVRRVVVHRVLDDAVDLDSVPATREETAAVRAARHGLELIQIEDKYYLAEPVDFITAGHGDGGDIDAIDRRLDQLDLGEASAQREQS